MLTHKWFVYTYFFFAISGYAQPCKIQMADITEKLERTNQVPALNAFCLIDTDSNEPINRYVQLLPDGSIVVVEQKHCLIYNLTVTFLLSGSESINKSPQRLAKILHETLVWQKWFEKLDAQKILNETFVSKDFVAHVNKSENFICDLTDEFTIKNETSEAHLRINYLDSSELPFKIILSFYIGVGGL